MSGISPSKRKEIVDNARPAFDDLSPFLNTNNIDEITENFVAEKGEDVAKDTGNAMQRLIGMFYQDINSIYGKD